MPLSDKQARRNVVIPDAEWKAAKKLSGPEYAGGEARSISATIRLAIRYFARAKGAWPEETSR